jgi:hypothetical protein
LKTWHKWTIPSLPAVPVAAKSTVIKAQAQIPQVQGPDFSKIVLSDEDKAFCNKILSSDALAAMLIDRIKKQVPTSVIRMSDGERSIIVHSQGGETAAWLRDAQWLRRYGLTGADLTQVGTDLLWAGKEADFLACTISGLFWDIFRVHQFFPDRTQFIDQFYPQLWKATDRVGAVLRAGPVLILHREHARLTQVFKKLYKLPDITGLPLNSWQDHANYLLRLKQHPASTILVSGGAYGKVFCVRLAQVTGKVVLDVGEAMTGQWSAK